MRRSRQLSKRWTPLFRDLATGLEYVIQDLRELAALDVGVADADWPELVRSAVGSLEGARALLHHAGTQRAAHIAALAAPGEPRH